MSESKPRVTIIGLGLIGTSIGLALQGSEVVEQIVGHDKNRLASNQAKSLGAVDKVDWNLISACERADLVILATPLDAIEPTLAAIGAELRRGCVVMDTASVKQPVLAAAACNLPEGVHFVGGHPIPGRIIEGSGPEAARADLFRGGVFCVVPAARTDSSAVKLVSDLVTIVGATSLFLDAAEHDGLLAAVDHLPGLLALALMEMATSQPTWRELRKMAGPAFETITRAGSGDPTTQVAIYQANRENLVRWLDLFAGALRQVRCMVAEDNTALLERLTAAGAERQAWLADWQTGRWQEGPETEMPERPGLLEGFLGGFVRRPDKRKR
ncbi:MAG: prephenate dehydrogenase/arogenate dehydrogenase family protein [Anaerolineae bacterium]|nr:prephenate dehydrogenase/arogenate dehydrogenase family protein [Anaerolineae bacterium]